jgi:pyruvate/2-oxoglutarate dehydrogenase complex dihydrolipoamide acyltransferase (E2) component
MPSKSWQALLDDAGDTGYEPLPEGDYDFVVEKAEAKRASTGKDMFVCTFQITGGAYNNRRVWHNFVVNPDNPNAMAIFFRNMNVLGLNAEYFRQGPSDAHVAEALRNRRFRGHVKQRQWNGETKNEVDRFFTAGGLTPGAPVNPAASLPQVAAPPAPSAPAPAPAPAPVPAAAPPAPAPAPAAAAPAPAPVVQPEAPAAPPVADLPVVPGINDLIPAGAGAGAPTNDGEAAQAAGIVPPPPPFAFAPVNNEVCD